LGKYTSLALAASMRLFPDRVGFKLDPINQLSANAQVAEERSACGKTETGDKTHER